MGLKQNQMDDLKQEVFATKFCQNYMLALKADVDVIEHLPPFAATTSSGYACEPQVVISAMQRRDQKGLSVALVVGNLRFRSPDGVQASIRTRQRVVKEALCLLEKHAATVMKEKVPGDDAHTPALLLAAMSALSVG